MITVNPTYSGLFLATALEEQSSSTQNANVSIAACNSHVLMEIRRLASYDRRLARIKVRSAVAFSG